MPFVPTASAQTYNLLAPLPGGEASVPVESGAATYMAQLFWFLLSAAAILALVMLVVGGVQYIGSAGNTSVLGDAKSRIVNALLGLVLAFAAWLILFTINPDLVDFSLDIPTIEIITGRSGAIHGGFDLVQHCIINPTDHVCP